MYTVADKIMRHMNIRKIGEEELSVLSEELHEQELIFREIFEQSPMGIIIGIGTQVLDANPTATKILGRSREELQLSKWKDYTHPDDLRKDEELYSKFESGQINGYSLDKRYIRPDGTIVWANITIAPLKAGNSPELRHVCLIEDITKRVQAEEEVRESARSKSVLLSNLPGMAYRCNYDRDWTMQFVSDGCYELTGYKPESLLNNKDISFNALINTEYQDYLWEKWKVIVSTKSKLKEEYEITTASGEVKWVFEQGQAIYNENGEVEALEGLIIDITDRKRKEEEINFLNNHDFLTGLYNRRFFEREKWNLDHQQSLPLTVLIGDINGLKLVNDAFGHNAGDRLIVQTSEVLKSCIRETDILARIGGDEFSILMPCTTGESAYEISKKIKKIFEEFNRNNLNESYHASISLGYATKTVITEDIDDIIRTAEDYMYKHKLLEQMSSHSDIVSSIKATMFERSHETQEHADRLSALSREIGLKLNLSQSELDDLELLATLHDIGKVGIDDRILNKPGKLDEKEWSEMKKHSEIGYRIAMASPELVPIAEYILCHHERWDGMGYPQGLKGKDIPLPSRILAVVDSYDAMTQDRIYRKAMSEEAAIDELIKNAASQFDPEIVDIFVGDVLRREKAPDFQI